MFMNNVSQSKKFGKIKTLTHTTKSNHLVQSITLLTVRITIPV